MRATISVVPPIVTGTISRMGRCGYAGGEAADCAPALPAATHASANAIRRRNRAMGENANEYNDCCKDCNKSNVLMGWLTGLEPATTGITIQDSTN